LFRDYLLTPPDEKAISNMSVDKLELAQALTSALRELDELSQLEADWDSYGGLPPTDAALAGARALLTRAMKRLAPSSAAEPFDLGPIAGGGILVSWRVEYREAQFRIRSDSALDVLMIDRAGAEPTYREAHGISLGQALDSVGWLVGDGPG
jgi:hypothetical protein